jgi:hypothetical protein
MEPHEPYLFALPEPECITFTVSVPNPVLTLKRLEFVQFFAFRKLLNIVWIRKWSRNWASTGNKSKKIYS